MFMSKQVEDPNDLPPLVEALRQLKYDPEENSSDGIHIYIFEHLMPFLIINLMIK